MKILALIAIPAYICLSILMSLQPDWFQLVSSIPGRDKTVHFFIDGMLCFVVVAGFSGVHLGAYRLGPLLCVCGVVALITVEETTQLLIPSRTFSLQDLGWSYAGIVLFGLAAILWSARAHRVG